MAPSSERRKRVLLGELEQETATFNPAPTYRTMFRESQGAELLAEYGGTSTQLGAALDLLAVREDIEVVPTYAASSVSGGPIPTADLVSLIDALTDALAAAKSSGPVDGIYLSLHGAMAGTNEDDPEGKLLTAVREMFGPSVPLVASLDLHAVLTETMVAQADILVPFHTYPHVDQYETGLRATTCLLRMLDNPSLRPEMVRLSLPMLVRGDELITGRVPTATVDLTQMAHARSAGGSMWSYSDVAGLFGTAIKICQGIEGEEDGVAAGVLIGNAFTDVPGLCSNVLVVRAGGGRKQATADCQRIGHYMWEHRESFQADLTSVEDAISMAEGARSSTRGSDGDKVTVFSDAADATASGASGDSNKILEALLQREFGGRALVPIVDGPAVAKAFGAGVGSILDELNIGGTLDPARFPPICVKQAMILSLHDGTFTYENGTSGFAGDVAVLRCDTQTSSGGGGSVDLLVVSQSAYFVGQACFKAFGLSPTDYDVVVIKSPNGFRPHYEAIAQQIIPVDVPGSTSANLLSLPYRNVRRPVFPLDRNAVAPQLLAFGAATLEDAKL